MFDPRSRIAEIVDEIIAGSPIPDRIEDLSEQDRKGLDYMARAHDMSPEEYLRRTREERSPESRERKQQLRDVAAKARGRLGA